MDRRDALKNLLAATETLISLPSWATSWSKEELRGSWFATEHQDTLRAVTDTIIPAGNSIGAVAVGVDIFLQKLIATCYDKDTQDNVRVQLENLERSAQQESGKSFSEASNELRQQLLLKLATSSVAAEKDFFAFIKAETIRGFSTSKEVMTMYLDYKVVPGHYYGCVNVKA